MFSKRLLKLTSLLATLSRFFGVSQLCFDPITIIYSNSTDTKVQRRVKRNIYILLMSIILTTSNLLLKWNEPDTVDFNICLVLSFIIVLLSMILFMWYFHSAEIAAMATGMFQYAFQLNRKSLHETQNDLHILLVMIFRFLFL